MATRAVGEAERARKAELRVQEELDRLEAAQSAQAKAEREVDVKSAEVEAKTVEVQAKTAEVELSREQLEAALIRARDDQRKAEDGFARARTAEEKAEQAAAAERKIRQETQGRRSRP